MSCFKTWIFFVCCKDFMILSSAKIKCKWFFLVWKASMSFSNLTFSDQLLSPALSFQPSWSVPKQCTFHSRCPLPGMLTVVNFDFTGRSSEHGSTLFSLFSSHPSTHFYLKLSFLVLIYLFFIYSYWDEYNQWGKDLPGLFTAIHSVLETHFLG